MSDAVPNPELTWSQRRVDERLCDRTMITDEQAAAASCDGNFFLSACPGSGKTYTVGIRLAYHAAFHRDISVAALSHTNTAVGAIQAAAQELVSLPQHYFVGTLHAFLLRYVVNPFGHLYMECDDVPEVAGDERDWPADIPDVGAPDHVNLRVKAWRFEPTLGDLRYQRPVDWPSTLTAEAIVAELGEWAVKQKLAYWRRGLLSYSDVLWVAYNVLKEHAELTQAVAARFHEVIVDEVQDTGELQLACLGLIRQQEVHPSLAIVGDLCQAVFEWSGATAEGVRAFATTQGLDNLALTANFRSSQYICDVTHRFSTRADPDRALGKNAAVTEQPEMWRYAAKGEADLVARFRARLHALGVDEQDAAVLAWTNALVDRLNGAKSSGKPLGHWLLRALGEAAAERDGAAGASAGTFERVDRAISYIAFGSGRTAGLSHKTRAEVRAASGELLEALPKVEGGLFDWNAAARALLAQAAGRLAPEGPAKNVNNYMRNAAALRRVDAQALTAPSASLARTIHQAKGESIAAVMVVARADDAANWAGEAWLDNPPERTSELLRLAYVGFTRAERVLILGIPADSPYSVSEKFHDIGFIDTAT